MNKKFRIHVITNHGQGRKFISEKKELKELLDLSHAMNSFSMMSEDGETYFFPAEVCHSSVFIIVPEED